MDQSAVVADVQAETRSADEERELLASNIRRDQLNILWISVVIGVTFTAVFALAFITPVASPEEYFNRLSRSLASMLALVLAAVGARALLRRERDQQAAWFFVSGCLLAIVTLMLAGDEIAQIAPFAFVLVVSIAGLLLPPWAPFVVTGAAACLTGLIPSIIAGQFVYSRLHIGAIVLTLASAVVARITAGQIFTFAEWYISSYHKSRERAEQLRHSRNELKKSLEIRERLNAELVAANAALEQAREVADEANRLKSQFVSNMSHELRTPLNAVINFARIILANYAGPTTAEQQEYLEYVRQAGEHLLGLINDMLDLAKIESGKLEMYPDYIDLHPIFKGVLATAVGLTADRGITLQHEVPDDLPRVWADDKRVRQVLINIYSNAAKYTREGSITLHARPSDGVMLVSVVDTGIGIPPDKAHLVFEEFRQADERFARSVGGTGLGMPISKKLVEMMGGKIWFESPPAGGTTFYFTLPLNPLETVQAQTRGYR